MNAVAILIACAWAVAYMRRMEDLKYLRNGVSFVLQNAVSAGAGLYTALDVATNGVQVLHGFMAITAGLYLLRSRDTYIEEISKPMELREIDGSQLHRASGGRKS